MENKRNCFELKIKTLMSDNDDNILSSLSLSIFMLSIEQIRVYIKNKSNQIKPI